MVRNTDLDEKTLALRAKPPVAMNKQEAARVAAVSERTLQKWMKDGLPYRSEGGKVVILRKNLIRWIDETSTRNQNQTQDLKQAAAAAE